jgi:hypothetical protein
MLHGERQKKKRRVSLLERRAPNGARALAVLDSFLHGGL